MIKELRKYFEFTGTISGTQYFTRNLVSSIFAFSAGVIIGLGAMLNSLILITLGVILLLPVLWFTATNIYKRVNAFYPNQATAFTIVLVSLQLISFGKGELLGILVNTTLFVIGILLIFCNSKVEEHKG